MIITPLANDERTGPRAAGYRRMLEKSPAGRVGPPDEIGQLGAEVLGPDSAFITGADILAGGRVTASYRHGPLQPTSADDD